MRHSKLAQVLGLGAALFAGSGHAADRLHPTVIELFQSQGCSSCPPADANVQALGDRSDLLTLSFGVTYWDNLGWKDTFAKPQFTDRQVRYAHALHHANVFTPQVVVNGHVDGVGADPNELNGLIRAGDRGLGGPAVSINAASVEVGAGQAPSPGADVLLVRYDPRIVQVPIRAGENGGRTLPHRNVVHELVRLGHWNGAATHFVLPTPSDPGLVTAILVQTVGAGPILAAARG